MNIVTMLDFRRDPKRVIQKVASGDELVMTYRGKAVMRLAPVDSGEPSPSDPIYRLYELAEEGSALPEHERDRAIDEIVYGG